ncbi:hypothetical protein FQN50_010009 [Emmonsiellopsis sp. PD_5]|nr:hypothetical protein FQN50_010009 [Emmonsiellopsis sp. PD_5]
MAGPKQYLNSEDFEKGLKALDTELRNDPMTVAFAPITVITAGGFLAVTFLKNRTATGDLDYLLPPQWADDKDIKTPLRQAIRKVATGLDFNDEWANDDVSLFVSSRARETLFQQAKEQNIVLFTGEHIRVLAAPIEWAIERKIRRLYMGERDRKAEFDMSDCLTMLKYLRDRNDGPLDEEHIRTLNVNGFDVVPDKKTMDRIAAAYCEKYNEDVFY